MVKKIFVNLPVQDVKKTMEFFAKSGFAFNPQFTDENAACMIVGDNIFVMLLVEKFFKSFIKTEICDSRKRTEAILALTAESRAEVDDLLNKVLNAGGTESREPQDHGWMYSRSFQDIDDHSWEIFYMDETAMPKG
jgi:uncharacterized protein